MTKLKESEKRLIAVFSILFLTVVILLLLIFVSGKKTYTVTFDLDGGTLVSGEVVQKVLRGESATPPKVTKDGCSLVEWSESYKQVTKDVKTKAVWSYQTTAGLIYSDAKNRNFTELVGAHEYIRGEISVGDSFDGKKLLGIGEGAFEGFVNITKVNLAKGLIVIRDNAFSGCTALTEINIPKTVTHIGKGAFSGCESLEILILEEGLIEIGEGAFENCTSLREVIIPKSVTKIDESAFRGCEGIEIKFADAEQAG